MVNLDETFKEMDNDRINLKKYFYIELEKIMTKYPITKKEIEIKKQINNFNNLLRDARDNVYTTKNDMDGAVNKIKTTRRVLNALI